MKIKYKTLEHERVEDAPFMGALISAVDCKFNCTNCFNQPIKNLPTLEKEDTEIIHEIKANIFNKGIIFGGLEWTLQPLELYALASLAHKSGLKTMLYTGNTFDYLKNNCNLNDLLFYFDYIKCGQYIEKLATINHIEYGVTLASSNQHIYSK